MQLAVFDELSFDFRFPLRRRALVYRLQERFRRHVAVLDSVELVVGEIRADGGEDVFEAPASLLAGVVVAVFDDGMQIDNQRVDGFERWGGIGKA